MHAYQLIQQYFQKEIVVENMFSNCTMREPRLTAFQVEFCQGNTLGGLVHPLCYPGTTPNAVLPRTIRGLGARLQAALTAVDANVLKAYLREWREANCHLPSNGRRALRMPVLQVTTRLPCFPLWHLAPWGGVSTTKRLRTYFTQHFYCLCRKNENMEILYANLV